MSIFKQEIDGIRFPAQVAAMNRIADENGWITEVTNLSMNRTDPINITMRYSRNDADDQLDVMDVETIGGTVRSATVSWMISGYKAPHAVEGILRSIP